MQPRISEPERKADRSTELRLQSVPTLPVPEPCPLPNGGYPEEPPMSHKERMKRLKKTIPFLRIGDIATARKAFLLPMLTEDEILYLD